MKYSILVALIASVGFASSAFSQGEPVIDQPVQATTVASSGTVQVQEQQVTPSGQNVYILNQAKQSPQITQDSQQSTLQQPTTSVQAAPLSASRAEQLRQARRNAELMTEQVVAEKLEESRIADEKRRVQKLIGTNLDSQPVQQVQPQVQAVQVEKKVISVDLKPTAVEGNTPLQVEKIEQKAVIIEDNKNSYAKEIKEESTVSSIRSELKADVKTKQNYSHQFFISTGLGLTEYDAVNVDSQIATSVSIGTIMSNKYIVEGMFAYSNHLVDRCGLGSCNSAGLNVFGIYDELDQYNFSGSAKFAPAFGRIRPHVGGLLSFTHRQYVEKNAFFNNYGRPRSAETDAFDIGVVTGVDIRLGKNLLIGGEYKYISNISSQASSSALRTQYRDLYGKPLEEFDYYTAQVVAKFLF